MCACVVNVQEFCKIYQQFFPFGDPARFASSIFRVFDTERDGTISFREFVTTLSVTSRGSLEEKLKCKLSLVVII